MSDANRALAVRWFDEVWNRRIAATLDELMASDCVGHMEGGDVLCCDDFKEMRAAFLSAFPDLRIAVEDTVAEGDRVAVRWRATGTHQGDGLGLPPTGTPIDFRGMTWMQIAGGRIVRGWDSWNQGALFDTLRQAHQAK